MDNYSQLPRTLCLIAILGSAFVTERSATSADLDPKIYSVIPAEVQIGGSDYGGDATDDATISAFNEFSWRSFIALNWPAQDWPTQPQRGVADQGKSFSELDRPRVWETWKAGFETIPQQTVIGAIHHPLSWNLVDDPTPVGDTTKHFPKVLGSFTKYGDISQADFGTFASPLVCQNHTYTHYEVRVNRVEYSTITGEGFYLQEIVNSHLGDPSQSEFQFPVGSVTVKAAWRELDPMKDDLKSYYTRDAQVLDYSSGGRDLRKVGLVGLHIVHKTRLRKQWIWTSFEHVSNIPGLGAMKPYSYNDGTAAGLSFPGPDPVGPTNPYVTPTPNAGLPIAQVVREASLHPQTIKDNAKFHALFPGDSVWKNYHLVLTQWPTDPEADENPTTGDLEGKPFPREPQGTPADLNVANTTLETWRQGYSCIRCHESAEQQGFDYVFFPIIHAQKTPASPPLPDTSHVAEFMQKLNKTFDDAAKTSRGFSTKRNSMK